MSRATAPTDLVWFLKHTIEPTGPLVYMTVGGFCCSVCAPATMSKEEVEKFALESIGYARRRQPWVAVDKSKLGPTYGGQTPNACNHWGNRIHWFLVGRQFAEEQDLVPKSKATVQ